jgi:hypothetical protein
MLFQELQPFGQQVGTDTRQSVEQILEAAGSGHRVSWHTGGSAHFSSLLALIPGQEVGLFISFNTPVPDLRQVLTSFMQHFYPAPPVTPGPPLADTAARIAALTGTYHPATVAYETPQKIIGLFQQVPVQPGDHTTLRVGPYRFREVAAGQFQQVDGPRKLTYATDAHGAVQALYWGPFAYFPLPWHQTLPVHLGLLAGCGLLFASAVLAGLGGAVMRRRRGASPSVRWAAYARWTAVSLSLLHLGLLAWLLTALRVYAETFIFPVATIPRITQVWWLSVPLTAALLVCTGLVWWRQPWRLTARIHYTLVTAAGIGMLWFVFNWNLIGW